MRTYLDNAATSFPKPEPVYAAVERYQRELGTAHGRATTRSASEVQRVIDRCRSRAARLFGAQRPEQVLFSFNGTDALNLALHGLLRPGDRAVATVWEHNSVLRPLRELQERIGIDVDTIGSDGNGRLDLDELEGALNADTRLVVVTHASNVTGIIQPVEEVVRLAHDHGALVLLDAAQTSGHFPVRMSELGVDLIATPGHKGLLGPLGTGLLVIRPGLERELQPIREGGTGTTSESDRQPDTLPERYEPGNHNVPGLFGLEAALQWHEEQGPLAEKTEPELELLQQLSSGLAAMSGVTVVLNDDTLPRVAMLSIVCDRIEPQVLASLLDQHFSIETRAGLHCAPLAHRELGTLENGGTVRFSLGPFTTSTEIDATLEAMAQITAAM